MLTWTRMWVVSELHICRFRPQNPEEIKAYILYTPREGWAVIPPILPPLHRCSFPARSSAGVVRARRHPLGCFKRVQVGAKDRYYRSLTAVKLKIRRESALGVFSPALQFSNEAIAEEKWDCTRCFCMFYSIFWSIYLVFPIFGEAIGFSSRQHSLKMGLAQTCVRKVIHYCKHLLAFMYQFYCRSCSNSAELCNSARL